MRDIVVIAIVGVFTLIALLRPVVGVLVYACRLLLSAELYVGHSQDDAAITDRRHCYGHRMFSWPGREKIFRAERNNFVAGLVGDFWRFYFICDLSKERG